MWKNVGLAVGFVAVMAAPSALHALVPAPAAKKAASVQQTQAAFAPTCKAAEVVDTRPDPAWVTASFAHDDCWAPALPIPPNGATATREQIVAAMATEKRFDAQADAYQRCVSAFIARTQSSQGGGKKPREDLALIQIESHRIFTSQENKKKAKALISNAINDFNEYGSACDDPDNSG